MGNSMTEDKLVWLDGRLVPWNEATISVSSHGLNYGIGIFEGIRAYSTASGTILFRLHDHIARLARSAAIYRIQLPFSIPELAAACKSVVRANGGIACYLRPLVFLGEGTDPLNTPFRVAIMCFKQGPLAGAVRHDAGVRAKISSFRRLPANVIPPAAKATGQYLNSYLAQTEVRESGYDEAILLSENGFVADGWAYNVFIVRDGTLLTPSLAFGALAGITRASIIALAAEAGISVREDGLVRSDLYLADECFLTGTAGGIIPVASIDGRCVGQNGGEITKLLTASYSAVTSGETTEHSEWRERI
jgi:branched-chain amino acid aminotransferase